MKMSASDLFAFIALTLMLGGGAAFLAGRALAKTWRVPPSVVLAALPLASAVRFLHATLADEPTDASKALLTLGLMIAFCWLGFKLRRRTQMARQYPWLAEKSAP